MSYLLTVFLYVVVLYLLFNGLIALLSLFFPTHLKNKKYWGFVLSGIVSLILGVLVYVGKSYLLAILGLGLPYIIRKAFGGEPELDPSKIQAGSKNLEDLIEEGVCLAEEGKYTEALDVLNNALAIDPQNTGALTTKANIYNRLRKYKEALQICETVIARSPKDVWALFYKGIALTNLSECLDAMRAFDRVLKITPDNQEAIKNKGRCHYKYYEGLGILKEMPDYTWEKVALTDAEVLIEEAGRILARKHGS
jgi:tetratricopeptide (TPR) repeat protein